MVSLRADLTIEESKRCSWPMTDTLRMEAAMCLWEAVLEEDRFPEHRQKVGAVQFRHDIMTLVEPLHVGWAVCDGEKHCPFDWEFCPWYLDNCVDPEDLTLFPNWLELCRA